MAAIVSNKLRNEREKEERGLWIENFGRHALPERVSSRPRGNQNGIDCILVAARIKHHAHTKETKIRGPKILHRSKSSPGPGQNDRNTQGCSEYVHHTTQKSAQRREHTFALPTRQASGQYVEHAGTGSDRQQHSGGEKQSDPRPIEHENYPCSFIELTRTLIAANFQRAAVRDRDMRPRHQ